MRVLIINSKGHWTNGWAAEQKKLDIIIEILEKASLDVRSIEVDSLEQLEEELDQTSSDTLVWVNAYWVNIGDGKLDWLSRYVENHNLPLIGQSQKTLASLLQKDECQLKLSEANIPTPSHIVISKDQISVIADIISNSGISFPMVVKPTNESRSSGVKIVESLSEAKEYICHLLEKYSEGNVIIEEFLPNDDITCGYIELNGEALLLPTYLVVDGMDCKNEVYGEEHYLLPLSAVKHVCVKDKSILAQLVKYMPQIVDVFDISSMTRIDSRANKDGVLSFFDTNGMPALNFPSSATIKQCCSHFSNYSEEYVFECLINTFVLDKLIEHNQNVPERLEKHNLFKLESNTTIKLELADSMAFA